MRFKRGSKRHASKRTIALVIAAGLWMVLGGLAAFAVPSRCFNEEATGADEGVVVGPNENNLTFVGVDTGLSTTDGAGTGVCSGSMSNGNMSSASIWVGRNPPGQTSLFATCSEYDISGSHSESCYTDPTFRINDPNTGSPGVTLMWANCEYDNPPGTWTCNEGPLIGAEAGTLSPTTNLPTTADGITEGKLTGTGTCIYATWPVGTVPAGCGVPWTIGALTVADGDLPTLTNGTLVIGGDTTRNTVTVTAANIPVPLNVGKSCVSVTSNCP